MTMRNFHANRLRKRVYLHNPYHDTKEKAESPPLNRM
jgi:hypothetical protein